VTLKFLVKLDISYYEKVCKSITEWAEKRESAQKYEKMCKSMRKCAKVLEGGQKYEKVHKSMRVCKKCKKVCKSMSESATNFVEIIK